MRTRPFLSVILVICLVNTLAAYGQDETPPQPITAESADQIGILTLLIHHTAPITEMAFSPNSTAFVSGSLDGTLCLWNVAGRDEAPGKLLLCLPDYNPGVTLYRWSPDERSIAVTGSDGISINIFNVTEAIAPASWQELRPQTRLPAAEAPILSLEFANEGQALLTADVFDTFTLYELESSEVLTSLEGVAGDIHAESIAIITLDGEIVVLDAQTGEISDTLLTEGVTHLRFSPNGRWLAAWGERTQLWDLQRGTPRPQLLDATVDNLQFTPDSQFMATWEGQNIRVWNPQTAAVTGTLDTHNGGVQSLTFTPNSQRAISIDSTGIGRLWDINQAGEVTERLQFSNNIDRVFLNPDSINAVVARLDFAARFYDIERGQLRGQYEISPDAEFSPDWTLIATRIGQLIVWHGLNNESRVFDRTPLGLTKQATNVRATPDTSQARIALIPANAPVFALDRTENSEWVRVILPDGTTGWVFADNIEVSARVENLPVATLETPE